MPVPPRPGHQPLGIVRIEDLILQPGRVVTFKYSNKVKFRAITMGPHMPMQCPIPTVRPVVK